MAVQRRGMTRRELLAAAGAGLAATVAGEPAAGAQGVWKAKKAVIWGMLPGSLSREDRFKLARDCGFDGIEAPPIADAAECDAMRKAAEGASIRIHSVIYGGWDAPLSSPNPEVRQKGMQQVEAALESAHRMGADDILLVPGIVTAETRYVECYQRSQQAIRRLIPAAERLKVMILVEEVWNKFLLSPLEFARYIDELGSPWVQAYFDVGNVVDFGWPEDWIRTLGKRIKRVHLKDFRRGPRQFVNLRDGDVNWPEVRRAFLEVGYHGFMTCELPGGDETYLKDLASRVDRIIAGT
ncbi:MAG: sugar phosphate isomerase/epimerase family protein [Chthonomonadales bacterium]